MPQLAARPITNVRTSTCSARSRCRARGAIRVAADQSFKIPRWEYVSTELRSRGLETVDVQFANELVQSGDWVLVDVRPGKLYEQAHPTGAASAPLYQPIDFSKATPTTWLRAGLFAVNGVEATEFNPNFASQIKELTSGGKGVILYCEAGGTIVPTLTFAKGKASRSLQAAYRILTEGLTDKVKHLGGGVYAWYQADLPLDGEYDTSNVGRTPNSATDAQFPSVSK